MYSLMAANKLACTSSTAVSSLSRASGLAVAGVALASSPSPLAFVSSTAASSSSSSAWPLLLSLSLSLLLLPDSSSFPLPLAAVAAAAAAVAAAAAASTLWRAATNDFKSGSRVTACPALAAPTRRWAPKLRNTASNSVAVAITTVRLLCSKPRVSVAFVMDWGNTQPEPRLAAAAASAGAAPSMVSSWDAKAVLASHRSDGRGSRECVKDDNSLGTRGGKRLSSARARSSCSGSHGRNNPTARSGDRNAAFSSESPDVRAATPSGDGAAAASAAAAAAALAAAVACRLGCGNMRDKNNLAAARTHGLFRVSNATNVSTAEPPNTVLFTWAVMRLLVTTQWYSTARVSPMRTSVSFGNGLNTAFMTAWKDRTSCTMSMDGSRRKSSNRRTYSSRGRYLMPSQPSHSLRMVAWRNSGL